MAENILQTINRVYQENIGQPFVRSVPGQAIAGYLGMEPQGGNSDAYKFGQGASMVPGLGAPAGVFKAATALPHVADAGQVGLGLIFGSKALKNGVVAKDAITAEQLLKNGATPNQVFQASQGLFKGPDGNWRRMASDIAFEQPFINRIDELKQSGGLVGDYDLSALYPNKALFEAYPELAKVKVKFDATLPANKHGSYSPTTKTLTLNPNKNGMELHSTLVHEIQHGIQGMEGWQQGGNAFSMLPENAQKATGFAEAAKSKILDRVTTAVSKHGIPRDDIINAARFMAFTQQKLPTTPEMKASFQQMKSWPADVKEIVKDYGRYGDVQAKLHGYQDDAFRHYQKLQGEAEAREVERQLQMERGRRGLDNPGSRYDNLHFVDLIKKGDTTSNGITVDWKENPLLRNSLLGFE